MLKNLDKLAQPVFTKLNSLKPKHRKVTVMSILGVSLLTVVLGFAFILYNNQQITLPETGVKTILVTSPDDNPTESFNLCSFQGSTATNAIETCSLRKAIELANTDNTIDTIEIRFSTSITEVNLVQMLPIVSRTSGPVKIIGRDDPSQLVIKMN